MNIVGDAFYVKREKNSNTKVMKKLTQRYKGKIELAEGKGGRIHNEARNFRRYQSPLRSNSFGFSSRLSGFPAYNPAFFFAASMMRPATYSWSPVSVSMTRSVKPYSFMSMP